MKKWIPIFLVFCAGSIASAGSVSAIKIEVRPVVEEGGSSSVDMKADDGSVFHVSKAALLTEKDLSDASVTPAGEHSTLNLVLNGSGAKQMTSYTSGHVGAKLAFVVDGELLKVPVVRVPIQDGKVVISFMPEDQALKLARSIHQVTHQR